MPKNRLKWPILSRFTVVFSVVQYIFKVFFKFFLAPLGHGRGVPKYFYFHGKIFLNIFFVFVATFLAKLPGCRSFASFGGRSAVQLPYKYNAFAGPGLTVTHVVIKSQRAKITILHNLCARPWPGLRLAALLHGHFLSGHSPLLVSVKPKCTAIGS